MLLKAHAVDKIPFVWFWPNGFPSCAIMTHDVEALPGRDFCSHLMDLDDAYGIKSSFQIVPEGRYPVSKGFLNTIQSRGFEIDIHDLNHDGHLFSDRERYLRRAERINRYSREYGAAGFRSAALYRNLDWYGALDFSYDMSVPNVGHLEAQRGGCGSRNELLQRKPLAIRDDSPRLQRKQRQASREPPATRTAFPPACASRRSRSDAGVRTFPVAYERITMQVWPLWSPDNR